jgi:feruloyl esterase
MNHCSGGPGTDRFDMLTPLVAWVERGEAPDQISAWSGTPGYFGVAARTRPLCPYHQIARYKGSGDINTEANFACAAPP